ENQDKRGKAGGSQCPGLAGGVSGDVIFAAHGDRSFSSVGVRWCWSPCRHRPEFPGVIERRASPWPKARFCLPTVICLQIVPRIRGFASLSGRGLDRPGLSASLARRRSEALRSDPFAFLSLDESAPRSALLGHVTLQSPGLGDRGDLRCEG